jgi:hypothetical protein
MSMLATALSSPLDVETYKVRFADITTNFDAPEGEVSEDVGIEADPLSEA